MSRARSHKYSFSSDPSSRTKSDTVRFLAPIGHRNDIEFGLGYDDSENYGEVTVFSVFLYFYGGG